MILNIPKHFNESSGQNDIVHKINDSTVVLLNRQQESTKTKISLTQHLIAFGIEGEKHYHSLSKDTVLHKNEVMFLKKGLFLTTEKIPKNNDYKTVLFFVSDNLLLDFFRKNGKYFMHLNTNKSVKSYFKFESTPNLIGYINSLLPYFEEKSTLNEPIFKIKFEELLLNLVLNDTQNTFKAFLTNLNKENRYSFEEFMEKNFTRNLRVEDFAYLKGMSISSFKRNFQKTFYSTPGKWLREKRVRKAEYLLQVSDKNINEISMEVGFENPSHFIQVFKSFYGMTPKKFQEKSLIK